MTPVKSPVGAGAGSSAMKKTVTFEVAKRQLGTLKTELDEAKHDFEESSKVFVAFMKSVSSANKGLHDSLLNVWNQKYTDETKNEEDAEKKVNSFPVVTPDGMEDLVSLAEALVAMGDTIRLKVAFAI